MSDDIYYTLRDILDTLPNGFPSTEDGTEIKLLKKIYTPEEAELTTKLKMKWETPEAIAERTGLDEKYLRTKLKEMMDNGQIQGAKLGPVSLYKLLPYVFGVYEFQLYRMDDEFVRLNEEYGKKVFAEEFFSHSPSIMKVVPIEREIPSQSVVETYESLTDIIDQARAWAVADCICKKEKRMLGEGCDYPLEVCIGLAPVENYFDDYFWGRPITKEEAHDVLKKAEEAGLVHMTQNVKKGQIFICNCCGCCCGVLRGMNEYNKLTATGRSNYVAVVDEDGCTACGICEERCQVHAIEIDDYAVINERCIGCGVCISSCPADAIRLQRRDESDIIDVPENEKDWNKKRNASRGKGDEYKQLL